jgi:hypothetical protein
VKLESTAVKNNDLHGRVRLEFGDGASFVAEACRLGAAFSLDGGENPHDQFCDGRPAARIDQAGGGSHFIHKSGDSVTQGAAVIGDWFGAVIYRI